MGPALQKRYPGEWLSVSALVTAASIGLYFAFLAALPACGPPRNSWLGQIVFVVPFAIVLVGTLVLIVLGHLRNWQVSRVVGAVLAMVAMTLAGDVFAFFFFFGLGHCGE